MVRTYPLLVMIAFAIQAGKYARAQMSVVCVGLTGSNLRDGSSTYANMSRFNWENERKEAIQQDQ